MRFLRESTEVSVGDTVEWTNLDPVTPHTITFGIEPANTIRLRGNVNWIQMVLGTRSYSTH